MKDELKGTGDVTLFGGGGGYGEGVTFVLRAVRRLLLLSAGVCATDFWRPGFVWNDELMFLPASIVMLCLRLSDVAGRRLSIKERILFATASRPLINCGAMAMAGSDCG